MEGDTFIFSRGKHLGALWPVLTFRAINFFLANAIFKNLKKLFFIYCFLTRIFLGVVLFFWAFPEKSQKPLFVKKKFKKFFLLCFKIKILVKKKREKTGGGKTIIF